MSSNVTVGVTANVVARCWRCCGSPPRSRRLPSRVANTVRAETDRTSTEVDALRAYYLASGAIDRAMLYIQWGPGFRNPDGTPKYFQSPMPLLQFNFPTGAASTEVIPETSKLNVNCAPPAELLRLLLALGAPADQAEAVVQGILDWRTASPGGSFTAVRSILLIPGSVFSGPACVFSGDRGIIVDPRSYAGLVLRKLHPQRPGASGAPRRPARLPVGLRINRRVGRQYR